MFTVNSDVIIQEVDYTRFNNLVVIGSTTCEPFCSDLFGTIPTPEMNRVSESKVFPAVSSGMLSNITITEFGSGKILADTTQRWY